MTWTEFFDRLKASGFTFCNGDRDYAGRAWWYPQIPNTTTGDENPLPPAPWLRVTEDRAQKAVFVEASFESSHAVYTEEPKRAWNSVEELLMEFDGHAEGMAGFGASHSSGGVYDFVTAWLTGNLGRKTKQDSVRVQVDGQVSTLYSYAVPIASIFDGRYLIVSEQRALERTSVTTNRHLRVIDSALRQEDHTFGDQQIAHLDSGRIPTMEEQWAQVLVDLDGRNEGRSNPRLHGLGSRMPTRVLPAEQRCAAMIRAPGGRKDELVQCRYAQLPGSQFCSRHQTHASLGGMEDAFKVCSCGKSYSEDEWDSLPDLGPPVVSEEGEYRYELFLKNCSCGSTMGMETREQI